MGNLTFSDAGSDQVISQSLQRPASTTVTGLETSPVRPLHAGSGMFRLRSSVASKLCNPMPERQFTRSPSSWPITLLFGFCAGSCLTSLVPLAIYAGTQATPIAARLRLHLLDFLILHLSVVSFALVLALLIFLSFTLRFTQIIGCPTRVASSPQP